MNDEPLALAIGGTGMLRPAVRTLLDRGQDVAGQLAPWDGRP